MIKVQENNLIKDIILRDVRILFENEGNENYYTPVWGSFISSNNYIESESKVDRNKTLSVEKYLN